MSDQNFIIFGAPHIGEAEISEVLATLQSGWLGTGPKVALFENDFGRYKGLPPQHVAAVNSCTAALHVSMIAANLKPGDEVITTPMTFCATINAIIHAGLTPVLADVEPDTFNIDPDAIETKITPRTRAILPVHFAGRPCNMKRIMEIARKHDLIVIEDCAHAVESEYYGQKTGTFGNFGCFSFYVTKNIITGEGGMVIAQSEQNIHRVKMLALHGMSKDAWRRFSDTGYKHYQVMECGFKYNMMDLQAAIGIHQLAAVDVHWLKRKQIWETYQEAFSSVPVSRPADPEANTRHAYHLYTLLINDNKVFDSRDSFLESMTKRGIGVGVHYLSIPEHKYYQETFNWRPEEYPHALHIGRHTVSLPLSPALSQTQVERIIDTVRKLLCP